MYDELAVLPEVKNYIKVVGELEENMKKS